MYTLYVYCTLGIVIVNDGIDFQKILVKETLYCVVKLIINWLSIGLLKPSSITTAYAIIINLLCSYTMFINKLDFLEW